MTLVIAVITPAAVRPQFALMTGDTLRWEFDNDGGVARRSKTSKIFGGINDDAWYGLGGVEEVSRHLALQLMDPDFTAEDLPLEFDREVKGLGPLAETAITRELLACCDVHRISVQSGALDLTRFDPKTGTAQTTPPGGGLQMSGPHGSSPRDYDFYLRDLVVEIKAALAAGGSAVDTGGANVVGRNQPCPCGSGKKYKKCHGAVKRTAETPVPGPTTWRPVLRAIRAVAQLYVRAAKRWGGPDGAMDDMFELGLLHQEAASSSVVSLHLAPTPAIEVMHATDGDLVEALTMVVEGEPGGPAAALFETLAAAGSQ